MVSDPLSAVIRSKDIVERAFSSFDFLILLLRLAKLDGEHAEALKDLISNNGLFQQLHKELVDVEISIPKRHRRQT